MGALRKADFYYGSLLSCFVNNGLAPAIIEPGETRRIYKLATNDGDFQIYAKYVSAPLPRQKTDARLWQFIYSPEEVGYIREYKEINTTLYFAQICGQERMQDSEIAILSLDQVKDCLDVHYDRESYRITIKSEKGTHGLKAYGTGRSDLLEGRDNTLRISRDLFSYLK
ncbi:hypothetical protein [Brevibacillus invocatus]|uniref:hypothetical protein n=1 Tax=Brevibacillus invocatus TaxID=173959 RepID=UPI0039A0EC70